MREREGKKSTTARKREAQGGEKCPKGREIKEKGKEEEHSN